MRAAHHAVLFTIGLLAFAGGRSTPAAAQATPRNMSPEAEAYLAAALDTIQAVTLHGEVLPWPLIRDSAFFHAYGARRPSDTWGAVSWALRRANRHSFLQAPQPGAASAMVAGRYGYIRVPQRGGAAVSLADSLHTAVRTLADAGACGWIVDLRGNGGGNMWPMLAGIGPLLGDSIVGYFGSDPDAEAWFYRRGLSGVRHPDARVDTASQVSVVSVELTAPLAPVAVLLDGGTGSSGEALAVAFLGRPFTRSFGAPTAGFATVNRGSALPDGANMVVTTGYYADRRRIQIAERIEPDVIVPGGVTGWPFETDRVAEAAAQWLSRQPACAASGHPRRP
jgi:carboxyl-terminal processing protease